MIGWYWYQYRPPVPRKRWVPTAPPNNRRAVVTWAEAEIPLADRRGVVTWAEAEVPSAPRRAIVAWAELEVPFGPRRAVVSWAEAELPTAPRRAIVTWAEAELPDAPAGSRRAIIAWAELEAPDAPVPEPPAGGGGRPRRIIGPGPWSRRAIVTWVQLEGPDSVAVEAPTERAAAGLLGDARTIAQIPSAPPPEGVAPLQPPRRQLRQRRVILTWVEFHIPDPPVPITLSEAMDGMPQDELLALMLWARHG